MKAAEIDALFAKEIKTSSFDCFVLNLTGPAKDVWARVLERPDLPTSVVHRTFAKLGVRVAASTIARHRANECVKCQPKT